MPDWAYAVIGAVFVLVGVFLANVFWAIPSLKKDGYFRDDRDD